MMTQQSSYSLTKQQLEVLKNAWILAITKNRKADNSSMLTTEKYEEIIQVLSFCTVRASTDTEGEVSEEEAIQNRKKYPNYYNWSKCFEIKQVQRKDRLFYKQKDSAGRC